MTGFAVGDEVIGYTNTARDTPSCVIVEAQNLTAKPATVPWEAAGSLVSRACTAYAAVRAVALRSRATRWSISGAAGGVGSLAIQLAWRAGAEVLGIASQHTTSGS